MSTLCLLVPMPPFILQPILFSVLPSSMLSFLNSGVIYIQQWPVLMYVCYQLKNILSCKTVTSETAFEKICFLSNKLN
jgi:hypothetical protein